MPGSITFAICDRLCWLYRFTEAEPERSLRPDKNGKEVKNLRLKLRHFRHVSRRAKKARKALKRLRTIAHTLSRELRRTLLCYALFKRYQKDFLFYQRVLNQQPKDHDKIYFLHEPEVYCIGKGKDHKP
ncbi:MAG: hypothetical protein ACXWT3_02685 [Methylococcaceae bacterium]